MRGADACNHALFTSVKLEDFVPPKHSLRPIRAWVIDAPANSDAEFSAMYEGDVRCGRPNIAPEDLMGAMLLQVRCSRRQRVEPIQDND